MMEIRGSAPLLLCEEIREKHAFLPRKPSWLQVGVQGWSDLVRKGQIMSGLVRFYADLLDLDETS